MKRKTRCQNCNKLTPKCNLIGFYIVEGNPKLNFICPPCKKQMKAKLLMPCLSYAHVPFRKTDYVGVTRFKRKRPVSFSEFLQILKEEDT